VRTSAPALAAMRFAVEDQQATSFPHLNVLFFNRLSSPFLNDDGQPLDPKRGLFLSLLLDTNLVVAI